MSKHIAGKHSRRGLFRLLGAGFLGAALAGTFARGADAGDPKAETLPFFNGTLPYFNFNLPQFNHTYPKPKPPVWNGYIPPVFNGTYPPIFNGTFPPHFN
ncbi:MAG TPA: hypothetical protein PLX85_03845 [Dehalococcoidia bacterium]|nr:hypothetical protein [Dehalococcoidia bacterium]